MKYSISVVYYRQVERAIRLIDSIHRYPPEGEYEILLVGDTLSFEDQVRILEIQGPEPWAHVHLPCQVPVSIKINLTFAMAKGEFIIRCDDDIEFLHPHWAERMAATLARPVMAVSAVTPGVASGQQKVDGNHEPNDHTGEVWQLIRTWWGGFCFMVRREVFDFKHPDYVGFYDTFAMAQGDDKDWLKRLHMYGYKALICPSAMVMHHGCVKEAQRGHIPAAAQFKYSQPNFEKKWKYLSNAGR